MSVAGVAEAVCQAIATKSHAFVLANLAPPDMVGHTGNYSATLKAIRATDEAIGLIIQACHQHNYALMITADHGNAEKMTHEGKPHTAHTCAPVPLIVDNCGIERERVTQCKSLCDVAPLVLSILDIPIPKEMTGSK